MRDIIKGCLLISVLVLVFPLVVSASETDLQINIDMITMRKYSGATVTDKYDVDLLTETGYRNANAIKEKQKAGRERIQTTLFTDTAQKETSLDDLVLSLAEEKDLFGDDYELTDINASAEKRENGILWTVLIISAAVVVGLMAGIMTKGKAERMA